MSRTSTTMMFCSPHLRSCTFNSHPDADTCAGAASLKQLVDKFVGIKCATPWAPTDRPIKNEADAAYSAPHLRGTGSGGVLRGVRLFDVQSCIWCASVLVVCCSRHPVYLYLFAFGGGLWGARVLAFDIVRSARLMFDVWFEKAVCLMYTAPTR